MQLLNSTMLQQRFNFCRCPIQNNSNAHLFSSRRNSRAVRCYSQLSCSGISVDNLADVLHNKVVVAATLSAVIGQLSKPFTSIVLYGRKFDIKACIQAGGFPSTHSSAVVATATSLALERGLSDPIFGMAVIYASLIMYDAQGVRREVGNHAKELNKVIIQNSSPLVSSTNDANEIANSFLRQSPSNLDETDALFSQAKTTDSSVLLEPESIQTTSFLRSIDERTGELATVKALKESIGHTEIEVAAGALLGFVLSLAICPYV